MPTANFILLVFVDVDIIGMVLVGAVGRVVVAFGVVRFGGSGSGGGGVGLVLLAGEFFIIGTTGGSVSSVLASSVD